MKRTTIMVDEALLYDLQRIARAQKKTPSAVFREALEAYVSGRCMRARISRMQRPER